METIPENEQKKEVVIVETKESIKITKNSRGYNYEFRIVAKEGVALFDQLDYVKAELDKRIASWTDNDNKGVKIK